jgi:predicted metalloprotease with PDZ domain
MRSSLSIIAALIVAAGTLIAGEPKCGASAKECEVGIRKLMSGGRRYLGVEIVPLNPGLIIKSVHPKSPAERAGLASNDRLIAVNGRSLTLATAREFKQILHEARNTGTLWVIVQRQGAYKKVDIKLEPFSKEQIDKSIALHLLTSHTSTAGAQ